jgi:hypothetical protein
MEWLGECKELSANLKNLTHAGDDWAADQYAILKEAMKKWHKAAIEVDNAAADGQGAGSNNYLFSPNYNSELRENMANFRNELQKIMEDINDALLHSEEQVKNENNIFCIPFCFTEGIVFHRDEKFDSRECSG